MRMEGPQQRVEDVGEGRREVEGSPMQNDSMLALIADLEVVDRT